jgi:hypothetical protein
MSSKQYYQLTRIKVDKLRLRERYLREQKTIIKFDKSNKENKVGPKLALRIA